MQLLRILRTSKKRFFSYSASNPFGHKKERIDSSLPNCGNGFSSSSQQSRPLSESKTKFCQQTQPVTLIDDQIAPVDMHGWENGSPPRVLHVEKSFKLGRACVDQFTAQKKVQFCRLYHVSDQTKSVLIPRQQEPEEDSPTRPFYNNPSLGIDVILKSVFRCRGELALGSGAEAFSGWVACPPGRNHKALAFSAGHCFGNSLEVPYSEGPFDFQDHNFSKLLGCFDSVISSSEFSTLGFSCSTKPLAISNSHEDLALFEIAEENVGILLPCSVPEECKDDTFMAAFSYPCTQSFLTLAYEELIEKKVEHGIKHIYSILDMRDEWLYELLLDTFKPFSDGSLLCSPGILKVIDGPTCHYKCSTAGGSSGGPIVLTHRPGYVVGIHDGGMRTIMWDKDCNICTSTDSDAFVQCYKNHVLPRLPSKSNAFWDDWDLDPFQRWLRRHGLEWTDRTDHEDVDYDNEGFIAAS